MLRQFIACLFLCLAMAPAHASTEVRACTLPLPPQSMQDSNGQPDGYATRILLSIAEPLDWQLQINFMPWLRVVQEAKNGNCDLVYTVLKRGDYESYMVFPEEPVLDQVNVLLVRRDSGIAYNGNLETFMRRHSIGLYRDKAVDEQFQQLRAAPWARIDPASTPQQNLEKLLAGRFDAAIENDLTAIHLLRQLGRLEEANILQPPLNTTPAYIVFPRAGRLSEQGPAFDAALREFKKTPKFKELQNLYLSIP